MKAAPNSAFTKAWLQNYILTLYLYPKAESHWAGGSKCPAIANTCSLVAIMGLIKYFLGTIDKASINDKIEIGSDEYSFCFNVLKDFSELIQNEYLFKVVELNYEDLKSKINYYGKEVTETRHTEFNTIFIDINRVALNLLSAMRTFLDHKETDLKRKFGAGSEELVLFEKEKKRHSIITLNTDLFIN